MKLFIVLLVLGVLLVFNCIYKNNTSVQYSGNAIFWLALVIVNLFSLKSYWWILATLPVLVIVILNVKDIAASIKSLTKESINDIKESLNRDIKHHTDGISKLEKRIEDEPNSENLTVRKNALKTEKEDLQKCQNKLETIKDCSDKVSFWKACSIVFNPNWF